MRWHTPVLRRQRQEHEMVVILSHRVSLRLSWDTRDPEGVRRDKEERGEGEEERKGKKRRGKARQSEPAISPP